jgi:predicted transcriptional regulator
MTINPTLRAKVIELYLQKRGRNEIARLLSISQGSVSNFLRAYKSKSESTTSLGQNCGQISNEHTTCAEDISTESQTISNVDSSKVIPQEFESFISNDNASIGVNINNTGSSVLIDSGVGKAVTTNTNWSANSNIVIPRDGGRLSHFLGEDNSTDDEVIPSVTSYSNSPSPEVPVPTSPKQERFPEPKSEDLFIKDPDSQDVLEEESEEPVGGLSAEEIESSKPKVRDSIEGAETWVSVEKSIHHKLEQERIAWDYYGSAWMGILKQIRREKDQRRHELLVIDRRKQKLSEWKKRLEQMQYDLTARESRILESERFLPLARQLQEMKLALEDALPWIEAMREKAEAENVDIRTTAINVAQELRLYRQSGGIQKQIERANQELALVNMATIQKQQQY